MSAAELSRRSGVTKQHLHKLLNNERSAMTGVVTKPSVDTVDKIAKGLGWNQDEARIAAGYAPANLASKPTSISELHAALERLGLPIPLLYGGFPKDEDGEGYQEILERIRLDFEMVLSRLNRNIDKSNQ